ncbi:MAG TPA: hypothetical protein VJ717_03830 [Gemmatimonadaceae bacterium]|nr:hypothetical protein [Gemmatimonadaceae bacterium]
MLTWLLAIIGAAAAVAASYARLRIGTRGIVIPAVLRGIAMTAALALLFNVLVGARARTRPLVAMDVSLSWARGSDSAQFDSVLREARRTAGSSDALIAFGDSVRALGAGARPSDRASRVRHAVERALVAGRPLVIFTDGEIDDPDAVRTLPAGSRVHVVTRTGSPDLAVTGLDAPRTIVSGDSIDVRVTIATASSPVMGGRLVLDVNGRPAAELAVDSLAPNAERVITRRILVAGASGAGVLRAFVRSTNDTEAHNDTLAMAIDLAPAAGAVLVSTSPDLDARELLVVLRGSLSLPTRGYLRVAPGSWRVDGALIAVTEDEVRRALQSAPLAIIHGDTAIFGNPRSLTRAALLLITPPPPDRSSGEWYATGAPASPVAAALSGIAWDSLPPLEVSDVAIPGSFEVLETRRARRLERRVAISGVERPRRVAIVAAAGFARWRVRGGAAADAFNALWGSLADWLATGASDVRAAVPASALLHAGEPVAWRRGSAADSVVRVFVTRRGGSRTDTLTLSFGAAADVVETAPMDEGLYDVSGAGGTSLLVVNPSREWYPRRASVPSGTVGSGAATREAPRARSLGWLFALAIAGFCAEWIVRRRMGLR